MHKQLFVAGAVAPWMSGAALADGMPARAYRAAPVATYDWSGVYFGGHVGFGWSDVDLTENLSVTIGGLQPPGFPLTSSHSSDGWLGGVHLGAMKQYGPMVLGVEVGLSGTNIDGSGSNCLDIATAIPGLGSTCDTKVNWLTTMLGRVGYAHDHLLVYGTAGWAVAGVNHRLSLDIPLGPNIGLNWSEQDVADGFAYGAGFEYALTKDIIVGLQYLHANLDSKGEGLLAGGVITTGLRELDLDTLTARLSFKWGG